MTPKYKIGDIVNLKGRDAILNTPTLYRFCTEQYLTPGESQYINEHAYLASLKENGHFKVLRLYKDFAGYLYELYESELLGFTYFYVDENWIRN